MQVKPFHGKYWRRWGLPLALAGCLQTVATSEAVQLVEGTFATYRPELEVLAKTAIADLIQSSESSLALPDRPYYESAWVSEALSSDAINVEFVIEEFYLPLVYVDTDNPQDVYDTCAHGGKVVKQLASHWYICQRDRN